MFRKRFAILIPCLAFLAFAPLGMLPTEARATEAPQMQNFGPANDDFAKAETLIADLQLVPGDLSYTTRELKEPKISTASIGRTVWYKYKATVTGRAVAFLTARYYAAPFQVAVYGGTSYADLKRLGSTQVAGTDTDYSGAVGFDAVKDTTYYIQIDRAPMASGNVTTFLLGVQPVGTKGKLAAFANQLLIFQERDFDERRRVFVANGHTGPITVTYGLSNMNNMISVDTTTTTLKVNQVAVFSFSDLYNNFAEGSVHTGSLDLISKATSNSSVLGINSVPLRVVTTEYTNKPDLEARFQDPMPGTPIAGRAQSVVNVRNTGKTTALGCRFDVSYSYYNAMVAIQAREVLANGTMGSLNPIFPILPGATRKFVVSGRVSNESSYRYLTLQCANNYGSWVNRESSYLQPDAFYGIHPSVQVRPVTDNVFGEIKLADFGSKRVYVDLKNTGAYSGYFQISADDDTYQDKAVVMSMCVVNASNACVGPSNTSRIEFDMAVGETRRVALDVRRGNSDPGEVQLTVTASDYDTYNAVGYGAFTLKK